MIVDAHQHFFYDPAGAARPAPDAPLDRRPFGPADLAPHLRARGVAKTNAVEAWSGEAETRDLLLLARDSDVIAGVVGWVDLTDPGVGDAIARHRAAPGGDRLVGIRHPVVGPPEAEWLLRPDVAQGLAAVAVAGLTFDLLIQPGHLPAAAQIARAMPQLRFIIDHLAKPPIASGELEPWASWMQPFGELPNVWCKVSGMVTEADRAGWQVRDLGSYTDHVLETFGPERLLYGSDWPVCLLAGTYEQVFDAAAAVFEGLSESERDAVFGGNAVVAYRL